ncbi:MAG: Hsp20/alpha crystallin family protein [Opitutaceae bacterium]
MKTKDIKMPYWVFALSLLAVGAVTSGIVYFSTNGGQQTAAAVEPEAVANEEDAFVTLEPNKNPLSPWWLESSTFDWSDPMERMREIQEKFFGDFSDPTQWQSGMSNLFSPMDWNSDFGASYTLNEDDEKFEVLVPVQESDEANIETTVEGQSLRISVESKREEVNRSGGSSYTSRSDQQKVFTVPLTAPIDESGVRVEMSDNELRVIVPKLAES